METDNNAAQCWHTVVPTALGELTLVRVFGHQLGSNLIMRVANDLLLEEPRQS
jgi:hypothetical protein